MTLLIFPRNGQKFDSISFKCLILESEKNWAAIVIFSYFFNEMDKKKNEIQINALLLYQSKVKSYLYIILWLFTNLQEIHSGKVQGISIITIAVIGDSIWFETRWINITWVIINTPFRSIRCCNAIIVSWTNCYCTSLKK